MKKLRAIATLLFWVLILALLVAPIGLLWNISQEELTEYATPEVPIFRETAVGNIKQATRQDVSECIILSGVFTSTEYEYIDLSSRYASSIRWEVKVGAEVQEGQVIGTYQDETITSPVAGILDEINTFSNTPFARVKVFTPIVFEANVEERTLSGLERASNLSTEDGEPVELLFTSKQKNADGTTRVQLRIDSERFTYGQTLGSLKLLTGAIYQRTLVLPVDCVYQRNEGDGEPWYVRKVTEDGIFLEEVEVQTGYTNGEVICVSGINEGEWFDSGYKAIVGGQDEHT